MSRKRARSTRQKTVSSERARERALLVGVQVKRRSDSWTLDDSLKELSVLARSAGVSVAGIMKQRLDKPSQTYVGRGKLEELKEMADHGRFNTVICDDELAPSQQRDLEKAIENEVKVIDRTALILDVFGRRAQTREGKLQVELAQHEYLLPRLAGQWTHLERQASTGLTSGGIGTRGPGEAQIETDRRLVRGRIQHIKRELEDVRKHRGRYRAKRVEEGIPVATLVGYTNAGKSTLLNQLTGAGVPTADRLFSTLDPVTRRLRLPSGRDVLVTDTVGFIQKLPPMVVAAFRATLEEIDESAIILHVIDITHPNAGAQADVVAGILKDLALADKPQILVLNKTDLIDEALTEDGAADAFSAMAPRSVFTSALDGSGLGALYTEMDDILSQAAGVPVASASP